jgi:hypothetical protein
VLPEVQVLLVADSLRPQKACNPITVVNLVSARIEHIINLSRDPHGPTNGSNDLPEQISRDVEPFRIE